MADTFGLQELPAAPGAKLDPKLAILGSYAAAVLNADLQELWWQASPRQRVVERAFAHDPGKRQFTDKWLPALFVFSESAVPQLIADDVLEYRQQVQLLWVFRPAKQDHQAARDPFFTDWINCLGRAFTVGRHPAWRHPDDTDKYSPRRGSTLQRWSGISRITLGPANVASLDIPMEDGSGFRPAYDALRLILDVEETLERDPRAYSITGETGLTLRIVHPDGEIIVERHLWGAYSAAFSSAFYGGLGASFDQAFSPSFH